MIRLFMTVSFIVFLFISWPAIKEQLDNPEVAVERVQTELNSLKNNPEVMDAAFALIDSFQDLLKQTWVLIREINEDHSDSKPHDAESVHGTDSVVPLTVDTQNDWH
ncbi:hypothetical protein A8F94_01230 [Bacillus sp. FJAT-27225]|uniref:hypothetical protein n=1 Tax=Bacillus sp. FJAT-27225 TaxID=1743144 RepID=UPI00080C347F|nr:hypothetical protein [Bacillus sp. FJAT-27225]OCA90537.1 hypothetical protein A8F94_01230 [Bacillus sp. FJAT-27225]